jgi:hypothetical protein
VDAILLQLRKKAQGKALSKALRELRVAGAGELPDHVRKYILAANLLAGNGSPRVLPQIAQGHPPRQAPLTR